jgi:hypothetical protein
MSRRRYRDITRNCPSRLEEIDLLLGTEDRLGMQAAFLDIDEVNPSGRPASIRSSGNTGNVAQRSG